MENENLNITPNQTKSDLGPIIGAIIIIIILIAGAWYFIGNRIEKISESEIPTDENSAIEITTGTSTELEDIQTDLENINVDILLKD